jgi:chemotaxis receptor (MCP) glutamine deamidase CheD
MDDTYIIFANNLNGLKKEKYMSSKYNGKNKVDIIAGEFMITHDSHNISINTLLGSCISMCVYDVITGYYGMNHYIMPVGDDFRHGLFSIEKMIGELIKLGSEISNLECKIYGGASMNNLKLFNTSVGDMNADFAHEYFTKKNIKIKQFIVKSKNGMIVSLKPFFLTSYKELV